MYDDNKNKNAKAIETKLAFHSKVKEENILVEADEERLTQVIDNILDNAFKFTDYYRSIIVRDRKWNI